MTTAVTEKKPEGALASTANYLDERLGVGGILKNFGRKVFPDHWSFMLGEVALYSFVILLISGIVNRKCSRQNSKSSLITSKSKA